MKKHYEAPAIAYEDFSLSASIAAGCEVITTLPTEGKCGLYSRFDGTVWVDASTNCDAPPSGDFEKICYHNPSDWDRNLFSSL